MQGQRIASSDFSRMIDEREVLELSRKMIRIPSRYNQEQQVSDFIFRTLDRWDLAPRRIDVPGCGPDVIAETGPRAAPSVVLNGHMDTVEVAEGWHHDPFGGQVAGGRLYGLGALDMKSGLAALMIAFRTIAQNRLARNINVKFQAVSGEELSGIGTGTLVRRGEFRKARAVLVGEGFGGLRVVTNARRGGFYFDIHVLGRSAHAALPELGINAVVDSSRIVSALYEMKLPRARGLVDENLKPLAETQTVLSISGGTKSLSVPEKCSVRLVRNVVPGRRADVGQELRRVVQRLRLRSRVRVVLDDRPGEIYWPYLTPPSSRLVTVASSVIERYTEKAPRLVCGVSEADDNIIAEETGVPVICVGPGETGERARYHQAEESISISQLKPACEIYLGIVKELSG